MDIQEVKDYLEEASKNLTESGSYGYDYHLFMAVQNLIKAAESMVKSEELK